MTQLADYSTARFTGQQLAVNGFAGSIRYFGTQGYQKNATRWEVQSQLAAGLAVLGVFERDVNDCATGFGGGRANAQRLLADADACGVPQSSPLFVCADKHLYGANPQVFRQYVLGAKTVLGPRTGAYGFFESIDAVADLGIFYWQCGSSRDLRAVTHLWQRNDGYRYIAGYATDINEVRRPIEVPGSVPTITHAAATGGSLRTTPKKGDDVIVLIYKDGKTTHVALNVGGVMIPLTTGPANNAYHRAVDKGELPWLALTAVEWNAALAASKKLQGV